MFETPKTLVTGSGAAILRRQESADGRFLEDLFLTEAAGALRSIPDVQAESLARLQLAGRAKSYSAEFPQALGLVAVVDDQPCGHVLVAETNGGLHVVDLAVHTAARRRGLGAAMVRAVMDMAGASGLAVTAETLYTNHASLRLFEGLGFQQTGQEGAHVRLIWRP